jgi:uncharacterized RDD family membrane protein YckC
METPPTPEQPRRDQPSAPAPPPAPPAGPQAPPGGWEQPIAPQPSGWHGRPLASWGSRVAAWFIDGLIIGIPTAILVAVFVGGAVGLTGDDNDTGFWVIVGSTALSVVVFAILALIYAPTTMARKGEHNGQTWGKQMIGIRVVRDTGQPMDFWWAALREIVVKGLLVGIASSIIPFIPWFLDNFWPLWDDENRALHDMVVSTHVVRG